MLIVPVWMLVVGVPNLAPVDADFLKTSAEDSIAELRLVSMAANRTQNPQVKRACAVMTRDHTQQLTEIRGLAKRLSVDLPTEPNETHKALYKHLSRMKGSDFDKSFVGAQLQDHINDVNTFQDEVEVGVEPGIRKFAKKSVPVLARHEVI